MTSSDRIFPSCAGLLAQQPALNLFPNGYQAALMDAQAQAQQQQQALGTSAPMQASGMCAYPAAFRTPPFAHLLIPNGCHA